MKLMRMSTTAVLSITALSATAVTGDSLSVVSFTGVPLIVGGLIVKGEDSHFRNLRNDYLPFYHRPFENYMQFAPAAVMFGMKALGVESRSSWSRMLTSDAFSAVIMAGVVNSLKHSTHVMRPDGTDNRSFPSGHTATAFMTATMLTKEYGHLSPWIGVGAYGVASASGVMRMVNNKHWLSDVLTGAGIGILSTEVGYYLSGLLFKDKGLHKVGQPATFDRMDKPSFLGLYLGVNVPVSRYDIDEDNEFRTSSGSVAGAEGAWFLNPYVGIGGRLTVSNTYVIVNGNEAADDRFDAVNASAGAYFSYPLSARWRVGSKLLGGYVHYPALKISSQTISARDGAAFGSGLSLTYRAARHYGLRFLVDYNLMPSHSRRSGEWMNTFTVGASFVAEL